MNLKQHLDKLPALPKDYNCDLINIGDLVQSVLGIYFDEGDGILVSQFIPELSWICTDTHVGVCVHYFADTRELALISYKNARKNDTHYYWINKEAVDKFKKLILERLSQKETVEYVNLEEDMFSLEEHKKAMEELNHKYRFC